MSTTQRKSSKSTSAASGSGNTANAYESVTLKEPIARLLLSATEIEEQLGFAVDGDLNQKHLQEVSLTIWHHLSQHTDLFSTRSGSPECAGARWKA